MKIKGIREEDFTQYLKPSLFIAFPRCNWKCDIESGEKACQNGILRQFKDIEVSREKIISKYTNNPITKALVCGGLEPFDTYDDLIDLIAEFRIVTNDDIVIYTGYDKTEIPQEFWYFIVNNKYENIIIKYGRYVPNDKPKYDEVLGVYLASQNQWAERIC